MPSLVGSEMCIRDRSYAASGKVELVSVHLCDSGHRAIPTSPRLERGVTFGVGQRKEWKLCPKPLHALRIPRRVVLRSGSTFHGETALVGMLLVARTTCNEGVPAHKEFLRARQTLVPLICVICWVLACTAPRTRYFCRLRFSIFSFFSLRRMGKSKA